jgi:hypothetical protein
LPLKPCRLATRPARRKVTLHPRRQPRGRINAAEILQGIMAGTERCDPRVEEPREEITPASRRRREHWLSHPEEFWEATLVMGWEAYEILAADLERDINLWKITARNRPEDAARHEAEIREKGTILAFYRWFLKSVEGLSEVLLPVLARWCQEARSECLVGAGGNREDLDK